MMALNIKSSARTNQPAEGIECSGATPDICGDRRTHDAELWKWTKSEYETGPKHYIDGISQPQNAHRDCSIAGTAKDGVDHEKHHDRDVAREHNCGKSPALGHYLR